ncbi:hypothetical protein IYY11_20325 [Methylocystis sp. H62]|uniref:hypothetical protein n=1 Tax=Methylocystis sp. H62 TaxID=2785789 RepID=UPI0018C29F8A|nr:hypothetical protein [Methylocystis sp. H62]MBG0795708.1 hypothetical protein [Methylocystis sp. H62]
MGYYLRIVGSGHAEQVWRIKDRKAVRLGVSNPERGPGSYFEASQQETIWEAIERGGWSRLSFHKIELDPRQYCPRMARPLSYEKQRYMRSPSVTENPNIVALGLGQANARMRRLDLICQTVHPAPDTLDVFGHEIRNLLILASTEVEAHWRGVLVANRAVTEQLRTRDYVRLVRPMRLDGYAVSFSSYPWLPAVKPFFGWNTERPTKSLSWYDAYNQVKHDREGAFRQASLEHAINAVSACVVMLAAQFTPSIGLGGHSDLSAYFRFQEIPQWTPSEIYCDFAEDGRDWTAVQHPNLRI